MENSKRGRTLWLASFPGLDRIWASPRNSTGTRLCQQLMHDRDGDLILTSLSLLPVADAGKVMLHKDHMSVLCMVDNPTPNQDIDFVDRA
jgi:hypothetical protein